VSAIQQPIQFIIAAVCALACASAANADEEILEKICITNNQTGFHFESRIVRNGKSYIHQLVSTSGDIIQNKMFIRNPHQYEYGWHSGPTLDAVELYSVSKHKVSVRTHQITQTLTLTIVGAAGNCPR